jgi:hypothetical protein
VLREDAPFIVTFSNRMFAEKAVAIWWGCSMSERAKLVGAYFLHSGGWDRIAWEDRSPLVPADPLFAVWAYAGQQGA